MSHAEGITQAALSIVPAEGLAEKGIANLAMNADQIALKELIDEATYGGRKALSQSEAKSAMDLAKEVDYPGFRVSENDLDPINNHWIMGPHFHFPGVGSGHIPVKIP